ncbi:MAG: cation:dicarboxylase symporter family transporter, partial [Chlamydiota bacterium]
MLKSLGYQVLIAIIAGIATGLFLGEHAHVLEPIGQIFFTLLQMVVLPYIPFMLIHGLGSLSGSTAKQLFQRGWIFFVLVWVVGFAIIYALTYLIPTPQMAFINPNAAMAEAGLSNTISFLVPENLIYDFANNIVPAIAVFGLIAGLAVMRIEKNDYILKFLEQVNNAIEKVMYWLALFSPVAIFSHMAAASGSLRLENLGKMGLFLGIYFAGVMLITFWFFPMLLTSLTSLRYRDVMREFRLVCLIPFATAIPSLAFPFIYLSMQRIAKLRALEGRPFVNTTQTVLPLTFAFGQIGNFFILFFVTFLAFFTHHPLTFDQDYLLPILTLPLSVGSVFST